MVQLAHIFKKDKDKDREKHHTSKDHRKDKEKEHQEPASPSASPRTSTSFSTARNSSSKPSPKPKSPSKSPSKNRFAAHSRSSSSTSSYNPTAPSFRFGTRSSKDQDLHPLNLPPDELRRRLSAMAASRDDTRSSMDIDPQEAQQKKNGVNGTGQERSPTPPPHRSNSSSTDEADNFKLAGNKFFKDGDYRRAIEEYNKGMPLSRFFC